MTSPLSKQEIKQLRKRVPHGVIKKIHEKYESEFNYTQLQAVLLGRYYSQPIVDRIIEFMDDYEAKQEKAAIKAKNKVKKFIAA